MEKWTRLLIIVSTCLLLILLIGIVMRLAFYIQHTLLLFSLGAILAYALDPLVSFVRQGTTFAGLSSGKEIPKPKKVMSRSIAITIVYLGFIALIGVGVYALAHPLSKQIQALRDADQQKAYISRSSEFLASVDSKLKLVGITTHLEEYLRHPESIPANYRLMEHDAERAAVPILKDAAVTIGESVIVLLISLYLLIYCGELKEKFNRALPINFRIHVEVWEEDVNKIIGGFVRGQMLISLIIGGVTAVVLLLVGIHLWLLLAIFAAIASLVPVFGPYIGSVPAILMALVGPTHFPNNIAAAIVILVYFIIINEIASKILYPRLVGQAIGLHEVIVLFVIFAGLEIGKVVGVLFAAPATAMVIVTVVHLYRFWLDLPDSLLAQPITAHKNEQRALEKDAAPKIANQLLS